MVSQDLGPRRDPASVDRAGLEEALRPFGDSRMLPRGAYVDPAVFEWEQRHFFGGGWMCVEVDGPGRQPIYSLLTQTPDANGEAGDIQWKPMRTADAVVVGGRTVGAWCAYFLREAGLDRVVPGPVRAAQPGVPPAGPA
jgi:hypothetical protein